MELLVFFGQAKSSFPSLDLVLFLDSLSSQSSLSNESLNLGGFMSVGISIDFALKSSSDCVLLDQSARVLKSLLAFSFLDSVKLSDASGSLRS